jgi:hypothetical protein
MSLRSAKWLWGALIPLLLVLATATPAWAAEPVTLELQAPERVMLGDEVNITAVLRDASGAPAPGATVILWSPASFLSVGGSMELGRATTDAQGRATLVYQVRTEEKASLNAYFPGDSRYSPAQASADIQVQGSAQLTRHPIEGVRVPGVGVWILAAILGGVWSTYFAVMVLLTLIAREGSETSREARRSHA